MSQQHSFDDACASDNAQCTKAHVGQLLLAKLQWSLFQLIVLGRGSLVQFFYHARVRLHAVVCMNAFLDKDTLPESIQSQLNINDSSGCLYFTYIDAAARLSYREHWHQCTVKSNEYIVLCYLSQNSLENTIDLLWSGKPGPASTKLIASRHMFHLLSCC